MTILRLYKSPPTSDELRSRWSEMQRAILDVCHSCFPSAVVQSQIAWLRERYRQRVAVDEGEMDFEQSSLLEKQKPIAPGDIVILSEPFMPQEAFPAQRLPFTFGIVAEILRKLPSGQAQDISAFLYDPDRREILLGPYGVPQFIDLRRGSFQLYKRAADPGYKPVTRKFS